jgi:hypothetical protein
MRRARISSSPASVSKRQPASSFTIGIGSGQASLPVASVTCVSLVFSSVFVSS